MLTANSFKVRTEAFSGPLELLLDLIERRKLHINDISLSEIADDYLSYIEKLGEFPTKDAAHFLVAASTLVLIKSRSLLPTLALSEEEQASISDLEGRLKLLAQARELSYFVEERFFKNVLFYREADYMTRQAFSPHADMKPATIFLAVKEILANLPKKEHIPRVIVQKVISMEEIMNDLTERIRHALSVSFQEFASSEGVGSSFGGKGGAEDRAKIVIGFLAILELVKRGIISVRQNERFEDIEIEGMEINVPRYY